MAHHPRPDRILHAQNIWTSRLLPFAKRAVSKAAEHPFSLRPEPGRELQLAHKIQAAMGMQLPAHIVQRQTEPQQPRWHEISSNADLANHYSEVALIAQLTISQRVQEQIDVIQADVAITHSSQRRRRQRAVQVVVLMPHCCTCDAPDDKRESQCAAAMMQHCSASTGHECHAAVAESPACNLTAQTSNYKLSFFAALRHAIPDLQSSYGWSNLQHVQAPINEHGSDVCRPGARVYQCSTPAAAQAALAGAEVIILEAKNHHRVMQQYPNARYILVDTSDSGTLHPVITATPATMRDSRIMAVLKPHVLRPKSLNNGALFANTSHLAQIAGTNEWEGYQTSLSWHLDEFMLSRVRLGLNHMHRFRHFLDCGSQLENARFAGFFSQNFSHWDPTPIRSRSIDVLYFIHAEPGAASRFAQQALRQHRRRLAGTLRYIQAAFPSLRFSKGLADRFTPDAIIASMLNSKVYLSPLGAGEWAHLDFQAMMCGCLVLKPGAHLFRTYPNVFVADELVSSVHVEWGDLRGRLQSIFQDLDLAQFMAKKATLKLLEYSSTQRYAGDLDILLSNFILGRHADPALFPVRPHVM